MGALHQESGETVGVPRSDQPAAAGEGVEIVKLHRLEARGGTTVNPGADDARQGSALARRTDVEKQLAPGAVDPVSLLSWSS